MVLQGRKTETRTTHIPTTFPSDGSPVGLPSTRREEDGPLVRGKNGPRQGRHPLQTGVRHGVGQNLSLLTI